jgi:serine/threonine protein kinase
VLGALEHAARGAHALHEAGLAHGGITPASVLLTDDGGGRLGTLDLAPVISPGAVPIGALGFRDPRLLAGAPPARRTEVFALGATVHHALSGTGLWGALPGADPAAAIRRVLSTAPRVSPLLTAAEAALVRDCTVDDDTRLPDALAVAERIAALPR